ncbi:MAG: phage holin family protein [Candidatus Moranbacteria bacterium]|nr:phage holin family protein [Candidatus Moranbacteria bacterium]
MRVLIRILANCAAILIAAKYIPGFIFSGSPTDLLIAGIVIGLINGLIKPIIELIALPVVFLTLGLFNIIINVGLMLLADKFLTQLTIEGFWPAFWGVVVISVVNHLISHMSKNTGDVNKF